MKLLALIKKEFARFFRDPKLIATMILPGLAIFLIYTAMGSFIWDTEEKYDFKVQTVGSSTVVEELLKGAIGVEGTEEWTIELTPAESEEKAIEQVKSGEITALLVFSENFDEEMLRYVPDGQTVAPQVKIYYRSADTDSLAFYNFSISLLDVMESAISNKFDVNHGDTEYDLSGEAGMMTALLGGVLPFLAIALIFSACMAVTLESVAGEKERGTLATILVTPVKRSHIALGKILPLACVALIGATSSFLGIAFSLPKLAGMSVGSMTSGYGFISYLWLFLLILSIVPVIVACVSVVSTLAKTVKEASAYTSVIMIFIMILSLLSSFTSSIGAWAIFVPVLNAVFAMQKVLSLTVAVWEVLVAVAMNLVYTGLLVALMSWMLGNEKIMFGK